VWRTGEMKLFTFRGGAYTKDVASAFLVLAIDRTAFLVFRVEGHPLNVQKDI